MFSVTGVINCIVGSGGLVYVLTYLGVIAQSRWKYPGGSSNAIVTFNLTIDRTSGYRIRLPLEEGVIHRLLVATAEKWGIYIVFKLVR